MKRAGALASALRSSGATVAAQPAPEPPQPAMTGTAETATRIVQRSRRDTKAITVHFPEEVRRQLKALAGEEGRFVDDMIAEAFNLLFAKYRKPELAPRKVNKS
jgi:hypothetical protein